MSGTDWRWSGRRGSAARGRAATEPGGKAGKRQARARCLIRYVPMEENHIEIPDHLLYTSEHEWVLVGDGRARLGITDYAQDALGDVVYAQLPQVGDEVTEGEIIAELESTKSVGEIYAPFDGEILAVNEELESRPELVNHDPYGVGWILDLSQAGSLPSALLDAAAYRDLIA